MIVGELFAVSWNETFIYEWTDNDGLLTGTYDNDDGGGVKNSSNTGVLTLVCESWNDVWPGSNCKDEGRYIGEAFRW